MARTISLLVFFGLSLAFSIVVHGQTAPVFDSTPVETGTYNSGYLYEITTTDAEDDDRSIFLSSGSLPVGLTLLDSGDGTASISGTPLETGSFLLELTVEENTGAPPQSDVQSFTLTINKATAVLTLSDLTQTYDGLAKPVSVTTTPVGLTTVDITYDGLTDAPTNAGSYAVVATLNNANYEG
ncbi:MAG: MBG domain-containing protein, partial [Bacteroidota bacterium]